MKRDFEVFVFEGFSFDEASKTLSLKYSYDSEIFFEEQIIFDFDFDTKRTQNISLQNTFFGIWIMCGISYLKAFLPPKIEIKKGGLSEKQKQFFEKTYTQGLGEFFYQNGIDPVGKVNFPVSSEPGFGGREPGFTNLVGSLVPLGGGKDSIVTAELLKEAGEDFETWTVGKYSFFEDMIQQVGKNHISVRRTLDPTLFKLNKEGALNGHVPISAILAFLGVASALLRGKKNVILSNEASANVGNTHLGEMDINHQYSKSLEFEKDFQDYVQEFISPDLQYFSLLRPLSELKIAQIFCKIYLEKYAKNFASCNRNFQIQGRDSNQGFFWCGKCPKCAFVFAIFAPFVKREKLIELFGGNLFGEPELRETFDELLGLQNIKPFECVGEVEEVRKALQFAKKSGEWPELKDFEIQESDFDMEKQNEHSMPKEFEKLLPQK